MNTRLQGIKTNQKDKEKKTQNENEYSKGEEISDAMVTVEDSPDEGDVTTSGEKNNQDIMKAIMSFKSGLYKKIDGVQTTITEVRKEIKECTGCIAHAAQRISDAEDNLNGIISKVSTSENTVKTLSNKVDNLECRSMSHNVRLMGLPKKVEGWDTVTFLEKWIPEALGMELGETLVTEQEHKIISLTNIDSRMTHPRTLIMKFLNFKDKERVLKAARIKRNVLFFQQQTGPFSPSKLQLK